MARAGADVFLHRGRPVWRCKGRGRTGKGLKELQTTEGQNGARSRVGGTCLARLFLAQVQESPGEWVPLAWRERRWPGTAGYSEALARESGGGSSWTQFCEGRGKSQSFLVAHPLSPTLHVFSYPWTSSLTYLPGSPLPTLAQTAKAQPSPCNVPKVSFDNKEDEDEFPDTPLLQK